VVAVPAVRIAIVASVMALFAACADEERRVIPRDVLTDDAITVGSFDFPESVLLAELYSQALESGGIKVERAFALGPREFVGPALTAGLIELVPEYAGTAVNFFSAGATAPSAESARAHRQLTAVFEDTSIAALDPAAAQNANAFVVTKDTAHQYRLTTLSDLASVAPELVLGGPPECPTRPLCALGLRDVYGLSFAQFLSLDAAESASHQALRDGRVDVAVLFRTDPALPDYVELTDDRHLQPAENVTPLLRVEVVEKWGSDVVGLLNAVSGELDTATLRELNATDAKTPGTDDVASIVAEWRHAEGLT
jgi:osmoprotectant transport system substrate-binding protein